MEVLNLKEKQKVSLYILKKVHEFCVSNNIHYSLAYGTLLGAIRHKGFIPWDDDIDLMMLRPDYDRFCSSFKMDGLAVYSHQHNPNQLFAYGRVCDEQYTVSNRGSWIMGGGYSGLWIDVFPIDSVEDEYEEYLKQYKRAQKYYFDLFKYRAYLFGPTKGNTFKLNCITTLVKLWPFNKMLRYKGSQFMNNFISYIQSVPFGTTSHYSQLAIPGSGSLNYLPSEYFSSFKLVPFEDSLFYIAKDSDSILQRNFGDYMQLPPIEERVPAHTDHFFKWKKEDYKELFK